MLVKDYMTRHPLMAEPTMSIIAARRYMGENNIRHLPVVGDGKRLLGLVTRQTLLVDPGRLGSLDVWEIARTLSGLALEDVMTPAEDVITAGPDITIEEAARIMVENKIGCLPVLEEGVVETRDQLTITCLDDPDSPVDLRTLEMFSVSLTVRKSHLLRAVACLRGMGATNILVTQVRYRFTDRSESYARLKARMRKDSR